MRKFGKIFRWIIIVLAVASIVGTLAIMLVNENVNVSQELGVMAFWLVILVIFSYMEYRSNLQHQNKE